MRCLLLLCAVSIAGCALRTSPGALPPGSSNVGVSLQVHGSSDSVAAVLITLGLMLVTVSGEPQGMQVPADELDPRRSVSEQDCTRPLEETGGNLRCR
jgi:hypothetical protein